MIKIVKDGYIIQFQKEGTDDAEYDSLLELFRTKPTAPSGCDFCLSENMEWQLVTLPPSPTDEEISNDEALRIITNGHEEE